MSDKIAHLSSRLTDSIQNSSSMKAPAHDRGSDPDEDMEDIFAQLEAEIENDDDIGVRERGMEELKREMERLKNMKSSGHGRYEELSDEKQVVRTSAHEPHCIVHFYHTDFQRCEIMDKHLAKLAPKYFSTRFVRVFVENVPWLVERLGVKVLPCVICFIDGVSKARLIGFEDLGNEDQFETGTLEWKLLQIGVIEKEASNQPQTVYNTSSTSMRHQIRGRDDDDSDFDLDD